MEEEGGQVPKKMGRRIDIPEITVRRNAEIIEGAEKVQIYAKGERSVVHSFPRIAKHHGTISFLPCVFV